MTRKLANLLFLCIVGVILGGCATTVPEEIRIAPEGSPTVAEVRGEINRFTGSRVRWGGVIAGIENREDSTLLEVVSRELTSSGRPRTDDRSAGRFLAVVNGFLDPAVYNDGREVTVNGILEQPVERNIDQYPYHYPVVKTEHLYLWEPLRPVDPYYHHPIWYDPWYHPYPYYRYPYWY